MDTAPETSWSSKVLPGAAIALVACVAGWLTTSSLQQDFAAYWVAGAARNAGVDPYINHLEDVAAPQLWDGVAVFAHSRFLYPPVVGELFRPFALLPYPLAKALFTALMVGAWVAASFGAARAAAAPDGLAVVLGVGALFYPLYASLERGQVDGLVLLLLVAAFGARARPGPAGAALAVAAAFKPALVGVLFVLAALGRWRVVGAALVGLGAVALASVALSGTGLAREYVTQVLPRASLYGEGGDASMLLPASRLEAHADDLEAGVASLGGRAYRAAAWDRPASASLPRLLEPERPTKLATRAPAILLLGMLVLAARGLRRRDPSMVGEALLLWAAVVACVVASPAGWVMGFVGALPLAPMLGRLRGVPGTAGALRAAVFVAGLACACPPPFAGWAAVAGALLVLAVVGLSLSLPAEVA
jgi:Glycosyltransferase family 87